MCDECYDNLVWTDEQIQLCYFEKEELDEEIIKKCWRENADYICFNCYNNQAKYATV